MSGQLCLKWNNHSNAFNKLLKRVFLKDENGYSDATILCHGKFYPVHRFVLSTCSEYFEEMFQQCIQLNNKHPFIIVKDIHPEQMEALLNYMYKGEVNVPQEHLPELIKAAEAFKIKGLAVSDEDEPPPKKKRSASSSNPSPVPKKSKKNDNFESSPIKIEKDNSEPYSEPEPLICEIKPEPLDDPSTSEEIEAVDNPDLIDNSELSIDKKEEQYASCEAFDFDNSSDQFQEHESESQWNEDFQSYQEGEGSQDDPSNRELEGDELYAASNDSFAEWLYTGGNSKLSDFTKSQKLGKLYKCDLCPCECSSSGTLMVHLRTHTGEKPFTCSQCPYRASIKPNLVRHMLVHTGEKPFICNQCTYKTTTKFNLIQHKRTHTGEKPFKCNLCNYTSGLKKGLINHMENHTMQEHK